MSSTISRRQFLQFTSVTALGLTLAACAPGAVPSAPAASSGGEASGAALADLIEFVVTRGEHPSQPILQDAPVHLATTEATNVKLNFQPVPSADYAAKQQVWMATAQVPDIMQAPFNTIRDFADPSVFMPVLPLIEEHAPNLQKFMATHADTIKRLRMNGDVYIIPSTSYNTKLLAPMPMIRQDLLDAVGLPLPETFDDLRTALVELKAANPGVVGWSNRQAGSQSGIKRALMITAYPYGSGVGGWARGIDNLYWEEQVDGGTWRYGQIHPEFKEVLDYFAGLYKDGLIDPGFANTTPDQWHEKNSSNQGIFSWDNFSFCVRWNQALRESNPDATWTPFPIIKGALGGRQNDYSGFAGSGAGWTISANCEDPVRAIKLLDWKISPEGLDMNSWGIEGTHYTKTGERPATIDDYSTANLEAIFAPGTRTLNDDIIATYGEKADPFRSYQSAIGAGQLDFAVLWDDNVIYTWDKPGEADAWYEMSGSDPSLHAELLAPSFTREETERIKQIFTDVNAILDPMIDKVVIGQSTLEQYDAAVQSAIAAGAQELEEIYNTAEARD